MLNASCFFWSASAFQAVNLGFLGSCAFDVSGEFSSGLLRFAVFLVGLGGGVVVVLTGLGGVDGSMAVVGEDLSPRRWLDLVVDLADPGWVGRLRIDFGMYWGVLVS